MGTSARKNRESIFMSLIIVRIGRISNPYQDDCHEIVLYGIDVVFSDKVFFADDESLARSTSFFGRMGANSNGVDFFDCVIVVVFEDRSLLRCDESCRIVDAAPREKVLKIRVSLPLDINDEFDGGVGVGHANFEARVVNDFALGECGVLAAGEFSGEFCGRCVFFDACVAVGGCSVEAHRDDVFDVAMCKFIGASDEDVCQNALIREKFFISAS